jgi:hypothetical protein
MSGVLLLSEGFYLGDEKRLAELGLAEGLTQRGL